MRLAVAEAAPDGDAATLSTTLKMYSQFSETSVSSVARATAVSISLLTADLNMFGDVKFLKRVKRNNVGSRQALLRRLALPKLLMA